MPTYEYVCRECGHTFEELQSMKEDPLLRCPSCGKDALARIMGGGSGLIFKGSGFYQTDYKKSGASASSGKETKTGKNEKPAKDSTAGKEDPKSGPAKGETTPPPSGTPDKKE